MEISDLKTLWQTSFEDPADWIDDFFTAVYSPDRCCGIEEEGRTAAALHWLQVSCAGERYAYLYAVATRPDCRGRGLCRKLMEQTHTLLRARGFDGCLLVPGDEGLRQMYRNMGYRDRTTVDGFSCAAGAPIPVRELSLTAYKALRRQYLPQGGAVQEGEHLALLGISARVYAGEGFLAAASREDGQLRILELLGDRRAAPGLTAALGCRDSTVRTPGGETPFAMFLPLREGAKGPDYFGLAFD